MIKIKKSHVTIIVIAALVIVGGALYYFLYYLPNSQATDTQIIIQQPATPDEDISNGESNEESIEESNEDNNEESNEDNNEEISENTGVEDNMDEQDIVESNSKLNTLEDNVVTNSETDAENNIESQDEEQTQYAYRDTFRNPFFDYTIVNDGNQLTIEAIREMVPFELKGIIGNNQERLAVIHYQGQTRVIKGRTNIEDFTILDILAEDLVMLYKGIQFKIEIRSGISEML